MADIRIDTSSLTYTQFLIPEHRFEFIEGGNAPTLSLEPGAYSFQQVSGTSAFSFTVTPDGFINYDIANENFLKGRGTSTLTILGFRITLDATRLSHDVLPIMVGATILSRAHTHDLTLVPLVAGGYGFQPAGGIVADVQFNVSVDGQLVVDSRYAGFTSVSDRTLTIRGYQLTIDARALSHDLLPLLLNNQEILSRAQTHDLTLVPVVAGGYGFQPAGGIVADVQFNVSVDGQLVVDSRYAGFTSVSDRTLTIRGYQLTIDARALSHDLLPLLLNNQEILSRAQTHDLTLVPVVAGGYGFQPAGGIVADVQFNVSVDGQLVVDPRYAGFTAVSDRTLTIDGYRLTIDARALSHDLLPLLLNNQEILSRAQTHDLTLVPVVAGGYSFQPAGGIVADFQFNVSVDGQLVVEPRYAGFTAVSDRTVTINGYRLTLDGRALSHDLLPLLLNNQEILSREQTHDVTLVPVVAGGYGFQPAGGVVADFEFNVSVDGQLVVDPRYAGFTAVSDRTLTINGYRLTINGRALSNDVLPALLGNQKILSRQQTHDLNLVPAAGYSLFSSGLAVVTFSFDVAGTILVDPIYAGVADASGRLLILRRDTTMPWKESPTSLTSDKLVVIEQQDGLHIVGFQPFLTLVDSNAGMMQGRIQSADGKLVFYVQSAITGGIPSVIFNTLAPAPGQPPPSAVEIHAQDGVNTVGFQPFLTLTDANAGFAKARIQNADGKLVFYVQSAITAAIPSVIFNTLAPAPGQPPPSAVEIHAQDGVQTVGFQPFLTLTDASAGFAKARIQNANGDIVMYTQGGITRKTPEIVVESGTGDVHVTGAMKVDKDIVLTGSDCAERFDLAEQEELVAGTVVIIDQNGMLRASREAYDKRVAGVVAGAGDYRPAIIMGSDASDRAGALVALVGKTYCQVDASCAAIEVGDLLTASPTRGYAMKASDPGRAFGAVIGKALRPLHAGMGLIPILVTLQ